MSERTLPAPRPELACREFVELVTDYLEGILPPPEVERIDRHLGTCDGCTTYLEQMRLTIAAAGHLEPAALPRDARRRFIAAYRAFLRGDL